MGQGNPGLTPARVRRFRPRAPSGGARQGGGGDQRVLSPPGGRAVKFYYFHLMPYIMEHDAPSSWVTLSNRHYDPAVGHTLYNQYLDQLEQAERLGWDGLCVNEHHQNCYGTMPRPHVMAGGLVGRARRAKIPSPGQRPPLPPNPPRTPRGSPLPAGVSGGAGPF